MNYINSQKQSGFLAYPVTNVQTCIGSRRIVVVLPAAGGGSGGRATGGAGARYFLTAPGGGAGTAGLTQVGGAGARYLTGLGGSAGLCGGRVICDVIVTSPPPACRRNKPHTRASDHFTRVTGLTC